MPFKEIAEAREEIWTLGAARAEPDAYCDHGGGGGCYEHDGDNFGIPCGADDLKQYDGGFGHLDGEVLEDFTEFRYDEIHQAGEYKEDDDEQHGGVERVDGL